MKKLYLFRKSKVISRNQFIFDKREGFFVTATGEEMLETRRQPPAPRLMPGHDLFGDFPQRIQMTRRIPIPPHGVGDHMQAVTQQSGQRFQFRFRGR